VNYLVTSAPQTEFPGAQRKIPCTAAVPVLRTSLGFDQPAALKAPYVLHENDAPS